MVFPPRVSCTPREIPRARHYSLWLARETLPRTMSRRTRVRQLRWILAAENARRRVIFATLARSSTHAATRRLR